MDPKMISEVFGFHPATAITGPLHDEVRALLRSTALQLQALTPRCPEQTLALRALQTAMMQANAAIAIHIPTDYTETPQVNPHSGATWEPGGGPSPVTRTA